MRVRVSDLFAEIELGGTSAELLGLGEVLRSGEGRIDLEIEGSGPV